MLLQVKVPVKKSTLCERQGLCGFSKKRGRCAIADDCESTNACKNFGACHKGKWLDREACYPTSPKDCTQTKECYLRGRCKIQQHANGWTCVVAPNNTATNCLGTACDTLCNGRSCRQYGRCHFEPKTNSCVIKTQQDCIQSTNCRDYGQCEPKENQCIGSVCSSSSVSCRFHGHCKFTSTASGQLCVPATDQNCTDSQACLEEGLCTKAGDRCIATTDAHCIASNACKKHGRCLNVSSRCGIDDCKVTEICKQRGLCRKHPSEDRCIAAIDADCIKSQNCLLYGWCKQQSGKCAFDSHSKTPCKNACIEYGHCKRGTVEHQIGCSALSDGDCAKSTLCKDSGKCHALKGKCVASATNCVNSRTCRLYGLCKQKGTLCISSSEEKCRSSLMCRLKGHCIYDAKADSCLFEAQSCLLRPCEEFGRCKEVGSTPENKKCISENSNDCQKSAVCKLYGHCFKKDDGCAAAFQSQKALCPTTCRLPDCKRDTNCKGNECCYIPRCQDHGSCLRTGGCNQRNLYFIGYINTLGCYPLSTKDCRKGLSCKQNGFCTYNKKYAACIASNHVDCQFSDVCKNKGECVANPPDNLVSAFAEKGTCFVPRPTATSNPCENTIFCKKYGMCTYASGTCQATADTDCKTKEICTKYGRCKARSFKLTDLHTTKLRGEPKDPQLGLYLVDLVARAALGQVGICVAFSEEDCQKSDECKSGSFQTCGFDFVKQHCTACRLSSECDHYGQCGHFQGKCIATRQADCTRSRNCKVNNKCTLDTKTGICK